MAGHSCKECLKNGDKCPNVQYFHCIILYTLHVFIWINVRFRFNLLYFHPQSVKEAIGAGLENALQSVFKVKWMSFKSNYRSSLM